MARWRIFATLSSNLWSKCSQKRRPRRRQQSPTLRQLQQPEPPNRPSATCLWLWRFANREPCLISAMLLRLLLLLSAHTYCAIHTRRYFTSYLYPSITWLLENSLVLTHMILCCTIAPYAHTFHAGGRAATVSAAAAPRTGRCGQSAVWNCRGSRCDKSCTTCLYLVLQWI